MALSFLFAIGVFGEEPAGKVASHETLIRISTVKEGAATHLFIENVQAAEVTVTLEMDLVNLDATVKFPCTMTLPGKKRAEILTLSPKDSTRGWSWTYTYYSTFGSTTAEHDDTCVYSLPYEGGKSYRISQGYNGEYSHFGADQFAIDWRMPLGTHVHAARDGVIVGIKNDSNIGGDAAKYDWDANYVLIQHADGTLGQYVHLQKGGCVVKLGQRVRAGDLIGLSGNTGHSTGPHLHFSVFKARDGKHRQTLPVRFRTAEDLAITLEEGKAYRASGNAALAASTRAGNAKMVNTQHPIAARQTKEPVTLAVHDGNAVGH